MTPAHDRHTDDVDSESISIGIRMPLLLTRRRSRSLVELLGWALTWTHHYSLDFWLCTLLLFLVEFGCAILGAPSPRLLEMAVCQDQLKKAGHFYDHDPPEELCKSPEVQLRLATLLTTLSTLSVLSATVMQIPMGLVVDRLGRRLALVLNTASTVLYWGWIAVAGSIFPIWCINLAPVFVLIGGGPWVTGALVFAAINDRVTSQQRTTAFSIMEATCGIADLVGPLLGSLTMTYHIGIPFLIATVIFSLMFIPAILITEKASGTPQSVPPCGQKHAALETEEPLLGGDDAASDHSSAGPVPAPYQLLHSKTLIYAICFGSFFLFYMARDSTNYLIPWVSLRFEWTMARAATLFSLRAIVSLVLYFALLPLASSWLANRWGAKSSANDLTLSIGAMILAAAGSFLMALAPNVLTLATGFTVAVLGSGMTVTLRSFLASNVDPSFSGLLFTAISTTGTVGSLVGMPLMGAVYSWGVSTEVRAAGLPFLVSAVSYFLVVGILLYFQVMHYAVWQSREGIGRQG